MRDTGGTIADLVATCSDAARESSLKRVVDIDLKESLKPEKIYYKKLSEGKVNNALDSVGKVSVEDELNCGGCGYGTCRDFARAMLEGKAEAAMCLSYLRKLAQRKSNALIKYIPAGVVIADRNLNIIECNQNFSRLFDESTRLAFEAVPGLSGVNLKKIVDFYDLFEAALASGKDVCRDNYLSGDHILNISVFTIEKHRTIGAIVQDVTQAEIHREHISEMAQEVIRKNVNTIQKMAKYLGEHMADTEILLREVASGYKSNTKRRELGNDFTGRDIH
ncbi:MAG: hypothetical protein GY750_10265 [Lentisphaerae bacterium]|nr:hypothetical protein [Lentisphaerota bacterium]MCP4101794.1 hypothetical protein [Lentisphaerota bacterium]